MRLDNGNGVGGDNLTFKYIDFQAGGRDTGAGDDVIYGLTGNSNITFSKCALHDSNRTIFTMRGRWTNLLIEHSYLARNTSTPAIHGELMSMTESSSVVARYNHIEDIEGTAVFAGINGGVADNFQVYGNVVLYTPAYVANTGRAVGHNYGISGFIFVANDASNNNTGNNFKVFNNTFYNMQGLWSGVIIQRGTGNVVQNNIWYNSVRTNNSGVSVSNNWYHNTQADNDASATKTICTSNCAIFADAANRDFRLAQATTAGVALPSPYNMDRDGRVRGADGLFDRGAFEFGGAPPPATEPLAPPTNLRQVSVTTQSIGVEWMPSSSEQTGFRIYGGSAPGASKALLGTTSATTSTYTESGLAPSSQRCYQVRAYSVTSGSETVESDPSAELCSTTLAGTSTPAPSPAPAPAAGEMLMASLNPNSVNNRDGVNYELGMKFRSVAAGTIKAIRFYKSPSETGSHMGKIYSANGELLASVVFTEETVSGWQQQSLSTPFPIAANTTYVVTVNTGNQYYVAIVGGMAREISSGNLRSIVGGNGVFGSVGAMPTQSWNDSNYFRDVVFAASATTDSQAPRATITSPSNGATVAVNTRTNIIANASDDVGVTKVEFYVNGVLRYTDMAAPYSFSWLVPSTPNKSYNLRGVLA